MKLTFDLYTHFRPDRYEEMNYAWLLYENMISFRLERKYPVSRVFPNNLRQPEIL